MNIKYQAYWANRKKVKTELATVSKWDVWNNTKYEKDLKKGKSTSFQVAKQNHINGLGYEFIKFEDLNDKYPRNYVTIVPENKHIGVNFIDSNGRIYLKYLFTEISKEKLFLGEVWYYYFDSEDVEDENYRIHFVFDEDGNVNYRVYDDIHKRTIDYESKETFDILNLYELYPEFNKYDGILKIERDIPILKQKIED